MGLERVEIVVHSMDWLVFVAREEYRMRRSRYLRL